MTRMIIVFLMVCCAANAATQQMTARQSIVSDMTGTWSATGNATIDDNTTNFIMGAKSIKVTTTGASVDGRLRKGTIGTFNGLVGVWVYVEAADLLNLDRITFYVGTPFEVCWTTGIIRRLIRADTWTLLTTRAEEYSVPWTGSVTPATFDVRIHANANGAAAMSVGGIITDSADIGGFVFQFDDAKSGVYDYAYPALKAKGWRGTVAVYSTPIDAETAGFMTLAQLTELYNAGWDIVSHSTSHPAFAGLTKAQAVAEIETNYNWLIANGFIRGANILAWPLNSGIGPKVLTVASMTQQPGVDDILTQDTSGATMTVISSTATTITGTFTGNWDTTNTFTSNDTSETMNPATNTPTEVVSLWYGKNTARPYHKIIRGAGYEKGEDAALTDLQGSASPWIPADWEQMPYWAMDEDGGETFADDFEADFNTAITANKVITIYTHDIAPSAPATGMSTAMLNDLIAWAGTKTATGDMCVLTYSDWWDVAQRGEATINGSGNYLGGSTPTEHGTRGRYNGGGRYK